MSNHSLYRNWCSSPGSCGLGVQGWRGAARGMIQGEPHSWGGPAVGFPVHAGVRWPNQEQVLSWQRGCGSLSQKREAIEVA